MFNKIITRDNFVFIISVLLSGTICYFLLGADNITLGIISVLFTYIIYSGKPKKSEYLYIFMWLAIILAGCYIGIFLKLSFGFYIFLFIISNYYYLSYNDKDPYSDRAIPYLVIYASLGTTISDLSYKSAISFFIGAIVALVVIKLMYKRKIELTGFKTGLFSKELYLKYNNLEMYNSLIYSFLLFLSLYIPDHIGLQRAYWAPMTFIMLLKPQGEGTIPNTIKRFVGSVLGGLVVIFYLNLEGRFTILTFIIIAVLAFMLPSFLKMKYLPKTFAITVFILLVLESTYYLKDPSYSLAYMRIFETFVGGSLAIVGSLLNSKKSPINIDKTK